MCGQGNLAIQTKYQIGGIYIFFSGFTEQRQSNNYLRSTDCFALGMCLTFHYTPVPSGMLRTAVIPASQSPSASR